MTGKSASNGQHYVPGLGFSWLTPLFDPVVRLLVPEAAIKGELIHEARIENSQSVLDIGCGTGTLMLLIMKAHSDASVTGLDGDPEMLAIARGKLAKAGLSAQLDHASADHMPYPDGSFDRVVSSLVFHHLDTEAKRGALAEAFRALRPGGRIAIVDIGAPHTAIARLMAPLVRRLERAADNLDGLIPVFMREAGFSNVEERQPFRFLLGTLTIVVGRRAG